MLETEEFHVLGGGCGGRMELDPILCAMIMLFPVISFQFTLVPMGQLNGPQVLLMLHCVIFSCGVQQESWICLNEETNL
jgi:hypothetical protein